MSTAWTITFDCADPAALAAFWCQALGYLDGAPPAGSATWEEYLASVGVPPEEWGDGAYIEDPAGLRPGISFLKVPEAKTAKNRIHLDVQAGRRRPRRAAGGPLGLGAGGGRAPDRGGRDRSPRGPAGRGARSLRPCRPGGQRVLRRLGCAGTSHRGPSHIEARPRASREPHHDHRFDCSNVSDN